MPVRSDSHEDSVWDSILGRDSDKVGLSEEQEEEELKEEEEAEDISHPIPKYFFLLTVVPFFVKVRSNITHLDSLSLFYSFPPAAGS